jgi:hypothetical protein
MSTLRCYVIVIVEGAGIAFGLSLPADIRYRPAQPYHKWNPSFSPSRRLVYLPPCSADNQVIRTESPYDLPPAMRAQQIRNTSPIAMAWRQNKRLEVVVMNEDGSRRQ